ncbi:MAG: outer membrane beta-barrel protein [Chitinophagaceae bacterium]|jgi:opacity protein-like surface antigen|nr:outer membrane beta-barrel protein [Chitinophagaceae bacterium]
MKKICFLLLSALAISSLLKAQYQRPLGSELSIGVEGALPMGGWDIGDGSGTKLSSFGVGVTAKYAYNFTEKVAGTFQTGYIYFPGKTFPGGKVNSGQIPFKVGVRASSGNFYFEPQLGISSFDAKANVNATDITDAESVSGSTTAFTYAIGLGVMASKNLDLGLRYEAMSKEGTISFLALRIAYTFPF